MLSHIDVVPSTPRLWKHPPLSGHIDEDGMLWGRGALDMKGMGALELMTMVWLKRLAVPLERDVILIAVADEEVDNKGMIQLVEHHWDRIGCEYLVNEGGIGVKDVLFTGQTIYPISVAEKGVLWVRMRVPGRGGHGSVPREDTAPRRFFRTVKKLLRHEPEVTIHPSLYELLARVGEHNGAITGAVLGSEFMIDRVVVSTLLANPTTKAGITNTINITGFDSGGNNPNVVPPEVSATLDCRLLPGTSPKAMVKKLQDIVQDPSVRFDIISAAGANESPWEDPVFEALATEAVRGQPHAVAGPVLSPGFTDSMYARQKGTKAYGFIPFEITEELGLGYHGPNERISVANVHRGLEVMLRSTVAIAAEP